MTPKPTSLINPESFAPARFATINSLMDIIVPLLLIGAALVALALLAKGAYTYITAGGDATKIEEAKSTMIHVSLGILVVTISFLIVRLITFITDVPFLL
jgi:hypothetical protein